MPFVLLPFMCVVRDEAAQTSAPWRGVMKDGETENMRDTRIS